MCAQLLQDNVPLQSYIDSVEESKGIVLVSIPNTKDNTLLNERLRKAFLAKGLGLSKYWLWEEDYNNTVKNGSQQRIYKQGNLGYSLLVQYMIKDELLLAAATVIPHLSRPLTIANTLSAILMGATTLLLIILIWGMSRSLEKAQYKIAHKNEQMRQLLHNVSHDLKTPIALIKAYTAGIKDNIDDGSFLDTIIEQNDRMEQLTLRLLDISRYEDIKQPMHTVDVSGLLSKELDRQMPLFAKRHLFIERNIQQGVSLQSNADALTSIFDNLISNAAKYATASPISVSLHSNDTELLLEIKNFTDLSAETKTESLWQPFCVAEGSRNSMLSGSGLGLSLVRAATNAIGAKCQCNIINGQFCVVVTIKMHPLSTKHSLGMSNKKAGAV